MMRGREENGLNMSSYGHQNFNSSTSPVLSVNGHHDHSMTTSPTRVGIVERSGTTEIIGTIERSGTIDRSGTVERVVSPNGSSSHYSAVTNGRSPSGQFSVALVSKRSSGGTLTKSHLNGHNDHSLTMVNDLRPNLRSESDEEEEEENRSTQVIVIKSQARKEGEEKGKISSPLLKKDIHREDIDSVSSSSSICGLCSRQFITYVLFVFNFILFSSGIIIVIIIIFYSSPAAFSIRNILPLHHPLNIVFYSLISTAIFMCITSIFNLCCTCCNCSRSKNKNVSKSIPSKNGVSKNITKKNVSKNIISSKNIVSKNGTSKNGTSNHRPMESTFIENDSTSKVLLRKDGKKVEEKKKEKDKKGMKEKKKKKDDVNLNVTRVSNVSNDDLDTFDIEVGFTSDFVHPSNSGHSGFLSSPSSNYSFPQNQQFGNRPLNGNGSYLFNDPSVIRSPSLSGQSYGQFNGQSTYGHLRGEAYGEPRLPVSKPRPSSSKSHLICSFIFILLLIFTIQLTISFIGFISSTQLEQLVMSDNTTMLIQAIKDKATFSRSFDTSLSRNGTVESPVTSGDPTLGDILLSNRPSFDTIESLYKCCGLNEFTDYPSSGPVPDSCCKSRTDNCGVRKHPSNIYYTGCGERVTIAIREELILLSSLALGFSFVSIFGLIFACCFYVQSIVSRNRVVI